MVSKKKFRSRHMLIILLAACMVLSLILSFSITVSAADAVFTRQPNSVTVKAGQTATTYFATDLENTADWKCYLDKRNDDGTWKISSRNYDSFTSWEFPYEAAKAGETYTYRIYMTKGTVAFSSNAFTVTYEMPKFTKQPDSITVKPGKTGNVSFSTDLTDTSGMYYKLEEKSYDGSWSSIGSSGGSFTSWQFPYDNKIAGKIKTYRVKIYKGSSSSEKAVYSNEFKVTYAMPEFIKQPDSITVKVDQTVTTSFLTDLPTDSDWQCRLEERMSTGVWKEVSAGKGTLTSWQFPFLDSAKGEIKTYRVKIKTYYGDAAIYSDKFRVDFSLPVFTRQPNNVTVYLGQTATTRYLTDLTDVTGWTCKLLEKTSDGGWRNAQIPGGTLTSWQIPYNEYSAGKTNTYKLEFNKNNMQFYSDEFTVTHAGLRFKTEPANLSGRTGDTVYANFELDYSDANTRYMLQKQMSDERWTNIGTYQSAPIPISVGAATELYRIKAYQEGYSGADAYSNVFTVGMGEYAPEFTTSIVGGIVRKDREITWNIDWKGNPISTVSLECKDATGGEFTRVGGSSSSSYTIAYTADKYNRRKIYRLVLDGYGIYSNTFSFSYIEPGFTPKLTDCTADYATPLTINFDTGLNYNNGWKGIKIYEKKEDGIWSVYDNVSWPYTSYTFRYFTSYAGKTYKYKLAILGDTDNDGNVEEFDSDEFSITYALPKFTTQPTNQTGEVNTLISIPFELETRFSGYITNFCLEEFYDGEWHNKENFFTSPVRIKVFNTVRKYRIAVSTSGSEEKGYSNEFTIAPIPTATATIAAPVAGQYPSFTATPGDPGKYSIKSVSWNVKEDGQWYTHTEPDFFFEAGKQYQVEIEFEPTEGNSLNLDGNYTINGNDAWRRVNGRTHGYTFTVEGTTTKLPAPTGLKWKETTTGQGKTTAAWDAVGKTDRYKVSLYRNGVDTGLVLETTATELDLADKMTEKGPGNYTFRVMAVGDGKIFTDSNQSGDSTVLPYAAATVTTPAVGAAPSLTVTSAEPGKYTAEFVKWYVKEDGDWYDYTRPDYTFKAGKEYMAEIRFAATSGNTLDPDGYYTINGNPTEWTTDALTRSCTFTICGVTIDSSGANAARSSTSGSENQTGITGAIDEVIYTADTGYYFPDDYGFTQDGITVSRDSYTQITVKGRPTASTIITLPSAAEAGNIVITTQPQTVNLDICTNKATFTVELENDAQCDSYNWQIYDSTNKQWFDMDTIIDIGNLSATGQHTKNVTIDVAGSNVNICSTRVRCVITRLSKTVATNGLALLKVNHRFDEYEQNNETTHKVTCSICGLEKTEEHLKKWICDSEATADTSGTKHFECPICGYESEPESYTVSTVANSAVVQFYKNDGTTETGAWQVFMEKENTCKSIPAWTLKKAGYAFEGWALTSDATEPLWRAGDSILMPKGTTTLYGVWSVAGVTVSGTVKSYNPNNATTITLYAPGNRTTPLKTATIEASTGSGQVTQNFSIPTVAAGTYDLVVTKPGHLEYTITGVVVGSSALDLTAAADKAYQTITLLAGDVNGDGQINSGDLNMVWKPVNYLKTPGSAGVENITDVNGDGQINSGDLNLIWNPEHYLKTVSNCIFEY